MEDLNLNRASGQGSEELADKAETNKELEVEKYKTVEVEVNQTWQPFMRSITKLKKDAKSESEMEGKAQTNTQRKMLVKMGLKLKAETGVEGQAEVGTQTRMDSSKEGKVKENKILSLEQRAGKEAAFQAKAGIEVVPVLKTRGLTDRLTKTFKYGSSELMKPGGVVDSGLRTIQPYLEWMKTSCRNLPIDYNFLTSSFRRLTSIGGGVKRGASMPRPKGDEIQVVKLGRKTRGDRQDFRASSGSFEDGREVPIDRDVEISQIPPESPLETHLESSPTVSPKTSAKISPKPSSRTSQDRRSPELGHIVLTDTSIKISPKSSQRTSPDRRSPELPQTVLPDASIDSSAKPSPRTSPDRRSPELPPTLPPLPKSSPKKTKEGTRGVDEDRDFDGYAGAGEGIFAPTAPPESPRKFPRISPQHSPPKERPEASPKTLPKARPKKSLGTSRRPKPESLLDYLKQLEDESGDEGGVGGGELKDDTGAKDVTAATAPPKSPRTSPPNSPPKSPPKEVEGLNEGVEGKPLPRRYMVIDPRRFLQVRDAMKACRSGDSDKEEEEESWARPALSNQFRAEHVNFPDAWKLLDDKYGKQQGR